MQKDEASVHLLPIPEARPSAGPLMASWKCVQSVFTACHPTVMGFAMQLLLPWVSSCLQLSTATACGN